jgi:hypothetical protein
MADTMEQTNANDGQYWYWQRGNRWHGKY